MQKTNEINETLEPDFNLEPLVTVGILTFNSARTLPLTLASLKAQTFGSRNWRVLFVDHGSTDETMQLLTRLASELPNVAIHSRAENNIAASRQWIVEMAKSPYIAFVDSDVVLPETWLAEAAKRMAPAGAPHLAGVGGSLTLRPIARKLSAVSDLQKNFLGHFQTSQLYLPLHVRKVDHLPTAAALFCRQKILQSGGFDPSLRNCGEDLELGQRLNSFGFTLEIHPELEAQHLLNCDGLRHWCQRAFRFGRARIQVARRHPRLWLDRQIVLPTSIFIFVITLIALQNWLALGVLALMYSIALIATLGLRATPIALATHLSYTAGEVCEILRLILTWGPNSYPSTKPSTIKPHFR